MNAPDHLAVLISRASQMTPNQLHALEQAAAALLAEPADSKTPTIPAPPMGPERKCGTCAHWSKMGGACGMLPQDSLAWFRENDSCPRWDPIATSTPPPNDDPVGPDGEAALIEAVLGICADPCRYESSSVCGGCVHCEEEGAK